MWTYRDGWNIYGHFVSCLAALACAVTGCGMSAKGEVFIHRNWTNDPWLLIGQGMRRAPWMFDPRYLRRPFYYRTESNRLATLFVLQHARYSPSYACYQFGHEIKAARYDFVYRCLRWIGLDIEE